MARDEKQSALRRVLAGLEEHVLRSSGRPGERLPSERALADKLDASRSTVREGLQRLMARGLLETRRGSGVFIASAAAYGDVSLWSRQQTPADRAELFEVRTMIESSAARLAARRSSPEDLRLLGDAFAHLERAVKTHETDEEAVADSHFHAALVAAARNSFLTRLYVGLNQSIRHHISLNTFEASHSRADAELLTEMRLEQHRTIHRCVVEKEPELAYGAATAHLEFVRSQFQMHSRS